MWDSIPIRLGIALTNDNVSKSVPGARFFKSLRWINIRILVFSPTGRDVLDRKQPEKAVLL